MVIDRRIGVVGTHNFDPRSENYNTEAVVVIEDPAFAQALAESISRDIGPANSWVVAPREKPPVLSGLNYSMGKVLEASPILDLWPWRYATNYAFQPGAGVSGAVVAARSRLPSLLRAGRRFPRRHPRPEVDLHAHAHRLRRGP